KTMASVPRDAHISGRLWVSTQARNSNQDDDMSLASELICGRKVLTLPGKGKCEIEAHEGKDVSPSADLHSAERGSIGNGEGRGGSIRINRKREVGFHTECDTFASFGE